MDEFQTGAGWQPVLIFRSDNSSSVIRHHAEEARSVTPLRNPRQDAERALWFHGRGIRSEDGREWQPMSLQLPVRDCALLLVDENVSDLAPLWIDPLMAPVKRAQLRRHSDIDKGAIPTRLLHHIFVGAPVVCTDVFVDDPRHPTQVTGLGCA